MFPVTDEKLLANFAMIKSCCSMTITFNVLINNNISIIMREERGYIKDPTSSAMHKIGETVHS